MIHESHTHELWVEESPPLVQVDDDMAVVPNPLKDTQHLKSCSMGDEHTGSLLKNPI